MWLARVHGSSAVADGLVTAALAGSVFFNISPTEARAKVALALIITVAPYAFVTPLIGPAIDRARGGRRGMMAAANLGRAAVALLLVSHIKTLLLFPEALAMLVLKSGASIATRAVVPKIVDDEERLVEANSKLALLSALGNMVGVVVGGTVNFIINPGAVCLLAAVGFVAAGVMVFRLPPIAITTSEDDLRTERVELAGRNIRVAGLSMSLVRGIVGFVSLLLAFDLRGGKQAVPIGSIGAAAGASTAIARKADIFGDPAAPKWHFGAVLIAAAAGGLVGSRIAPALRVRWREERLLEGVLASIIVCSLFAVWSGGLGGAMLVSLSIGFGAAMGKLAFDALVQRDAPDANYGRSFARFEARFQLFWVIGALVPVLVRMPEQAGYLLVALVAAAAFASHLTGFVPTMDHLRRWAGRPPLALDGPSQPRAEPAVADVTQELPSTPNRWRTRKPPRRSRKARDESNRDQLELFE